MTSSIDSDLLAATKSRPHGLFILFEFDLLSATTTRYSKAWAAASTGLYEGRVVQTGNISRSVSDSSFNLADDQATVTIRDDRDRSLEKILMGTAAGKIAGSAARIKLASRTLAQSKWFTVFSGVVRDFSTSESRRWTFGLKRDDKQLQNLLNVPTIQTYDWVNAPSDLVGSFPNLVYGKHSSIGTTVTGMVPTTFIDTSGFRYLISYGRISSLDAVYVDKVASPSTNWSLSYVETNGRWWSVVDFTASQGDAAVTVDCEGYETNGDGSTGTLIDNPATQIEHLLTNFVFGSWTNGTWLTTANFPINETFIAEAETYLSDKKIAGGSRVIAGDRKGIDVLNEWTSQLQMPSFWTYDGKIALRPDDHTLTAYVSAPHFRQELSPESEARSVLFSSRELVDEIRTEYLYNTAGGKFEKHLRVRDPAKGFNAAESLPLHWRQSA